MGHEQENKIGDLEKEEEKEEKSFFCEFRGHVNIAAYKLVYLFTICRVGAIA